MFAKQSERKRITCFHWEHIFFCFAFQGETLWWHWCWRRLCSARRTFLWLHCWSLKKIVASHILFLKMWQLFFEPTVRLMFQKHFTGFCPSWGWWVVSPTLKIKGFHTSRCMISQQLEQTFVWLASAINALAMRFFFLLFHPFSHIWISFVFCEIPTGQEMWSVDSCFSSTLDWISRRHPRKLVFGIRMRLLCVRCLWYVSCGIASLPPYVEIHYVDVEPSQFGLTVVSPYTRRSLTRNYRPQL